MKKGLIITEAFMEALRTFEAENFKDCMVQTYDYAINDIEPNFKDKNCKMLFNIFKPFIDSNNKRYEQKQKENEMMYGGKYGR